MFLNVKYECVHLDVAAGLQQLLCASVCLYLEKGAGYVAGRVSELSECAENQLFSGLGLFQWQSCQRCQKYGWNMVEICAGRFIST